MDYNARYYNPRLGRFVSPDSVVPDPSSSSGFNRYAYVMNNPVRFSDPTGHGGGVGTLSPPLQIPWQNLEKIGPPLAVSAPEALVVGTMATGLGTDAYIGSMWAMQDMGPDYPGNPWTGGVELIDPHPLIDVTTPLPGTDTIGSNLETITPPDVETPFELPGPSPEIEGPNTVLDFPTFDEPGLIPPVLAANNPWFEEIYYNGTPFGRQDSQRARDRDVLRDLAEEYPHIKSKAWQKVEQWFEYEGEDYDLHWFEARGIVERGKVDP